MTKRKDLKDHRMSDLISELADIATKATLLHQKCDSEAIRNSMKKLSEAANDAERAHSGSSLGYQSCVYYRDLERVPSGAFFDQQWGLRRGYSNQTSGDWVPYNYSDIYELLQSTSTKPTFLELGELANEVAEETDDIREALLSVIEACRATGADQYLDRMKDEATRAKMTSADDLARSNLPPVPPMTNDMTAVAGGQQVPPHVAFRAFLQSIGTLFLSFNDLAKTAKRTGDYLSKRSKAKSMLKNDQSGTRVFIGHGRSVAWLELKNYIQDHIGLQCDDFNRQATAGRTIVDRLTKMLDDARFALIVLTAEDEQIDGRMQARQNVIHEAGLFQGRLGFNKAIVMLEDGCEEFSNIHGLGQIRFEKGKISGSFHEVSGTLKREGVE